MKIYRIENLLVAIFIGFAIGVIALGMIDENQQKQVTEVKLSKCDSIVFANDSLVKRLNLAERRMQQYRIGLWFLRDKDKKAYDYVINAGNLKFINEWQ